LPLLPLPLPLCQNLTILPPTLHFLQLPKSQLWTAMPAITALLLDQGQHKGETEHTHAAAAQQQPRPLPFLCAHSLRRRIKASRIAA